MNIRAMNSIPSFGAKYPTIYGSTVNANKKAMEQAQLQKEVRDAVEKGIKETPDTFFKCYDKSNGIQSSVEFMIDQYGKCYFSDKPIVPMYVGHTEGFKQGKPSEVWVNKVTSFDTSFGYVSSDECGAVRANGDGLKYAYINCHTNPDAIFMNELASECFPE